jgi:hypothetical protein
MKNHYIPHVVGAGLLAFGLTLSPLMPVAAQTNTAPSTSSAPNQSAGNAPVDLHHTNLRNDQGPIKAGWLGLIGLVGLAGLVRGRRHEEVRQYRQSDEVSSSRSRR